MATVYRRCAGLDIHRDTVVACIRSRMAQGSVPSVERLEAVLREL